MTQFVVAKRDLNVTNANEIRHRIPAGSLVRSDNAAVAASPDEFYVACRWRSLLEVTQYDRATGDFLSKDTATSELPDMPPPNDRSEQVLAGYWRDAIQESGWAVLSLEVEQLGDSSEFVVRASVDRAAPPNQTPDVNVDLRQTIPEPIVSIFNLAPGATVEYLRDDDGRVIGAQVKSK